MAALLRGQAAYKVDRWVRQEKRVVGRQKKMMRQITFSWEESRESDSFQGDFKRIVRNKVRKDPISIIPFSLCCLKFLLFGISVTAVYQFIPVHVARSSLVAI